VGPLTYSRKVSFEDSALTAAIGNQECGHKWFLYRFGQDFGGLHGHGHADGGCRSMTVRLLLGDAEFARQLSRLPNPSREWGSLVAALESNSTFEDDFFEWWFNTEPKALSEWAATNGYWTPTITAALHK
jgi:hypothetical protein